MILRRFITLILLVLFGCMPALALDVCRFDERLMKGFVQMYPQNDSMAHVLLQEIAQNGSSVEPGECQGERLKKLQKKAASFLNYNGHPVKMINFAAMNLEDEEVAVLNLFFEYVEAKYNSPYSYAKNHSPRPQNNTDDLLQLLSELASVSYDILLSEYKNPTPTGVVSGLTMKTLPSWIYLWIRQDNPFTHDSYYDLDYSWLLKKRDIFLKSFPDGEYASSVKTLMTDSAVERMRQRDNARLNFHFGLNFMIGKSLFNSIMDDIDENFSFGFQGRFQFFSTLLMLQVEGLYGDTHFWGGMSLLGGYALLDRKSYGIDIYGGLSYVEDTYKDFDDEDSKNSFVAFAAGTQIFKRFPIGDMFDVVPKFQWQILVAPAYFDYNKDREGVGVANRFYIGIGFDGKIPMGNPRK